MGSGFLRAGTFALAAAFLAMAGLRADEGMWPPDRLPDLDWPALAARGLKLPPDAIWNDRGEGLAMAVVNLGGCTASFVSADGLMATNHHCAYRSIQRNSTPEDNILDTGFVALAPSRERIAPGVRAQVLRAFHDVTERVNASVPEGADDLSRFSAIDRAMKEVVAECEQKPAARCRVAAEFGGLRYVLFESLEIRDVRLVYAPPATVGEFGGEVDNWMWPRHTGDFALLRAYVAPDGAAADPAPANVPFHPVRHLRVSSHGVRPGDLLLVMGYPGSTDRYLPSSGIERNLRFLYPRRLEAFSEWIALLEEAGRRSPEAALAVAPTIKAQANSLKNARGMIDGLARNAVLLRKRADEADLGKWIAADPSRAATWGSVVERLNALYRSDEDVQEKEFALRTLESASKTFGFARTLLRNAREREKPDLERRVGFQARDQDRLRQSLEQAQKDLDEGAERSVTAWSLRRARNLPENQRITGIDAAIATDAAVDGFVERIYAGSSLGDLAARQALFERTRAELDALPDPMLVFARQLEPEYDAWERREDEMKGALSRLLPPYAKLLIERRGGSSRVYPDANGTLRLSFAAVRGYSPREGIRMEPQTSLLGLLARSSGEAPFICPARVRAAAESGDFGAYDQASLGSVPVAFLSDADTSGGNSGSPVVSGRGELVGLNFDRVFENIAGDYGYSPDFSRNISVDVRYLLWTLDRVEKADPLLREMGVK